MNNITNRPDPNAAFPNPKIPSLCYIKNVVKNPRIVVGDYTYYDDVDGADQFEKHVTHFYDFIGDRLIIGKFCAIAKGIALHGQTCFNSVYSALKSGVRLIDTAYMYGNEEEVGRAVRQAVADGICKRGDITVITKIYPGSQFSNPEPAIQERLDKLDIGYVDIMLLHHPGTNDVKAYKAMEKFLSEGKIKSLGLSCFYVKELSDFLPKVSVKPVLVQNEIHPYYQDTEVVDFIHKNNIVVQAWYPLGGRGFQKELLNDPVLADIAKAHGKSIVQVILRWHWQRNVVAIPGSSNPAHIAENHDIFDFELSAEEMGRIASLDRIEKHDWY